MPSPVPFLDLYASNRPLEAAFFREFKKLYRKSAFIGGPAVETFEKNFAATCAEKGKSMHCVAVSSGTAAIHLALIAAGVGPGDEVLIPAFTFPGAAGPVVHLGARPVFVDVRLEDGCLDPAAVARAVTPRTRAVLATHLFGHPADVDGICKALKTGGRTRAGKIAVIEDAAQAHGGAWRGGRGKDKPLGSLGDFGCFSFYPTKNLGGIGDSGAIVVKSAALAARLRRLRDHGQRERFHPEEAGFNARMNALHALFLTLKLPSLAAGNRRRAAIAQGYLKALAARPPEKGAGSLRPLVPSTRGTSAWHAFVVLVRNSRGGHSSAKARASFLRHLDAAGIGHQVYYPCTLPSLKAYQAFSKGARFPAAEELARSVVALPLHPALTAAQQARVRAALAAY